MKYLLRNFLRGVAITVPIAATLYIAWGIFRAIDQIVVLPFPGGGFLVTIAAVLLIGILGSNFVVRTILEGAEKLFTRAPIFRIVYMAIKDLTEAFVGERKGFDRPVLVDLPESGLKLMGFLTIATLDILPIEGHVAVYVPQAYNIAGNLIVVPASRVTPLSIDGSRLMTLLISGGVSGRS